MCRMRFLLSTTPRAAWLACHAQQGENYSETFMHTHDSMRAQFVMCPTQCRALAVGARPAYEMPGILGRIADNKRARMHSRHIISSILHTCLHIFQRRVVFVLMVSGAVTLYCLHACTPQSHNQMSTLCDVICVRTKASKPPHPSSPTTPSMNCASAPTLHTSMPHVVYIFRAIKSPRRNRRPRLQLNSIAPTTQQRIAQRSRALSARICTRAARYVGSFESRAGDMKECRRRPRRRRASTRSTTHNTRVSRVILNDLQIRIKHAID